MLPFQYTFGICSIGTAVRECNGYIDDISRDVAYIHLYVFVSSNEF